MPVVAFVWRKGGVGKTMVATILSTQLARKSRVTMIDADPNKPVLAWSKLTNVPEAITVIAGRQPGNADRYDRGRGGKGAVRGRRLRRDRFADSSLCDRCGGPDNSSDTRLATRCAAGHEGARAYPQHRKTASSADLHAVLFTRTNSAIRTRTLGAVEQQLAAHGVRVMTTRLHEREAFRAMFSFGGGLDTLPGEHVANRERAVTNARAFAAEVVELLREGEGRGHAHPAAR